MKKIVYCDQCAKAYGLEIQKVKKTKGSCQICQKRIEMLNETTVKEQIGKTMTTGPFKVKRLGKFIPGLPPRMVHPNMPYRIISDMTIYFPSIKESNGKRSIIVADQKNGDQIQIIFGNSEFKQKLIGTIDGETFTPVEDAA